MTTLTSVFSWDILVKIENGNIFFNKRDDSPLDYFTVNENSANPPKEEAVPPENSMKALHQEATAINQNFSQQVLFKDSENELIVGDGNPFTLHSSESAGYKYRKFNIGDIQLVARTQFDAYKLVDSSPEFILVKSLNEYDPSITHGWRMYLETLRNGAFHTQTQHNNNKMARWAVQAYLTQAFGIEIGYVSRNNPKDSNNHVILGVDFHRTNSFISELGVRVENMWGILSYVINIFKTFEDGNYVLFREPNINELTVYRLTNEDFETVKVCPWIDK